MLCENCGNEMSLRKGISKKTNKPYQLWKCPECEHIVWVNEEEIKQSCIKLSEAISNVPPIKPNGIDNSMKSMLLSYAKDIVVAQINQGNLALGVDEVIQDYKKLLSAL